MRYPWFVTLLPLVLGALCVSCRFISHINSQGFRGNFTFEHLTDANGSFVKIEATLEKLYWPENISTSTEIYLDWSIHSNQIEIGALTTCSDEELGQRIAQSSILSDSRPIQLNRLNSWTIPVNSSDVNFLGSLVWGKSILLKASQVHLEKSEDVSPILPIGLMKPRVNPQSINVSSRPTFPPRAKPSISSKLKSVSSSTTSSPTYPPELSNVSSQSPQVDAEQMIKREIQSQIYKHFGKTRECANIFDTKAVKTAEAVFESQIGGKVVIRGNEDGLTHISVNLYYVKSKLTTRHDWKILASDILDRNLHQEKCKHLQILFDPNNLDDSQCNKSDTSKCKMGDLTKKHGQIQIAGLGKNIKLSLIDGNLPLAALDSSRSLYLVIYDNSGLAGTIKSSILGCSEIKAVRQRTAESNFNMKGVRGTIKITQRYANEPSTVEYNLFGLEGNVERMTIRQVPVQPRLGSLNEANLCDSLGGLFDPLNKRDQFAVGNLSAKHGQLSIIDSEYEDHYMGQFMDSSVQLFGRHTVVGRSIAIHKNNGDPWVCSNIELVEEQMNIAAVTFNFPVVGRIQFHQLADNPHSPTGVLVDVYNPNSEKSSENHVWMLHSSPAMADFYNWSQRCQSTNDVFDPLQASVGIPNDVYNRQCQSSISGEPLRCRLGDLVLKSGMKLTLSNDYKQKARSFYTDMFLPLSGPNSIIGRSVVIYDDNSPTQRGNRLACSTIKRIHPMRAAVRSWTSGPSIPSGVKGFFVFEQASAQSPTRVQVALGGLSGNVESYAIHNVWLSDDREFPCSNDSLYDIYDPMKEDSFSKLPSSHYAPLATFDRIKVGDLSRKHGTLEGLQSVQKSYSDSSLPLHSPASIIGRSITLRASVNDFRWVCGNIDFDFDPKDSRKIVGIASFDDSRSKVSGYARFFQIEYEDGSLSDTIVQVDLRLQSDNIHEPETSSSHNWAIFVNQVGEDAYIAADEVRCIAAGFRWNPFLAQETTDNYQIYCNPMQPQGCAMGDLSSRHGSLTLGPNRKLVISDNNLPLAGNFSIMGRSLVIFDAKRPSVKLACTNILPDVHLKSNVVVKRTPSFTVSRFVEQMRSLLDASEWLIVPELRETKQIAGGECIQMTIHFYGQRAHQMQSELNNLVTLGAVRRSTRTGTKEVSTHFKQCRVGEAALTSSASSSYAIPGWMSLLINT